MKEIWKEIGFALILGFVLPGVILQLFAAFGRPVIRDETPMETVFTTLHEGSDTQIRILQDQEAVTMDLEEYITGVVLAEMPASFEEEALKAQAVVARTYAARAREGKSKHEAAVVCTDSACCQGYRSRQAYFDAGGEPENLERVRDAVLATRGLVLTYEGEMIEATYFSCSGGMTEDALAVWGTDVPYLVATFSPGEEHAAHYTDTITMEQREFLKRLGLDSKVLRIGSVSYTAGGGVDTMEICGETFSGTELRALLELPSTAMVFHSEGDSVRIETKGYGHRVGMSQYGADAMAVLGSSYEEILGHYYPGTKLTKLAD